MMILSDIYVKEAGIRQMPLQLLDSRQVAFFKLLKASMSITNFLDFANKWKQQLSADCMKHIVSQETNQSNGLPPFEYISSQTTSLLFGGGRSDCIFVAGQKN